ncbi:MAG: hypothetical protein QOE53_2751 [Pseudonocardiales bacterium]|jgi:hypothetical protein|nr:hypothetical protein [Pseudonocardiales bacterium]
MSETTPDDQHDPAAADDLRQHTQTDTEGEDGTDEGRDVPREHSEDPAEG